MSKTCRKHNKASCYYCCQNIFICIHFLLLSCQHQCGKGITFQSIHVTTNICYKCLHLHTDYLMKLGEKKLQQKQKNQIQTGLSKCEVSHFKTTSLENPQIMFWSFFNAFVCVCACVLLCILRPYFTVLTKVPWGGEQGVFSDKS